MDSVQSANEFKRRYMVETRARMIADPAAKLRYLQRAMQAESGSDKPPERRSRRSTVLVAVLLLLPLPTVSDAVRRSHVPEMPYPQPAATAASRHSSVWLVDDRGSYEVYSNGLRVENHFTVANQSRRYPVYDRETLELAEWRVGPVGIVYHTTENQQAPFNQSYNGRLKRVGRWMLEFVQRKRAYHFVVDRFGRVHRVVRETDTANHAGYSIWADKRHVYINLNPSFIGVSFETATERSAEGAEINSAQVHAARVLTEMLRSRYGIRPENCVSHAQVSVFPRAMTAGNHTDWAANFPFQAIGLGDNYALPHAAIAIFGFDYGLPYIQATGPDLWKGIALGENELRLRAAQAGQEIGQYKAGRKQKYREILRVIKDTISSEESES